MKTRGCYEAYTSYPGGDDAGRAQLARAGERRRRWLKAQRYNLAELHGGPLDGQVVQAPLRDDGRPEHVIGVPVPVLDEATERFWWDTGNYFLLPAANPPKRGHYWYYAYARTLPGYPTSTEDFGYA